MRKGDMQDILIIMNAPPRAGKDTLATFLSTVLRKENISTHHVCFKAGLERVAGAMLDVAGMYDWEWEAIYEHDKDAPLEFLGGMSPRQFYIHVSESVMKPIFGNDVFAKYLSNACKLTQRNARRGDRCVFLCSDGGFVEELETVANQFEGKVVVLQWDSEGCSFAHDSRRKLDASQFPGVQFVKLSDNIRDDMMNQLVYNRIQEIVKHPFLALGDISSPSCTNLEKWLCASKDVVEGIILARYLQQLHRSMLRSC